MINVKSVEEIELMQVAGRLVATTLTELGKAIKPGVKTIDLDRMAEEIIRSQDGIPSFKGFRGFPGSICTSVNSEVVHGIPGLRTLEDGDIISIDVGAIYRGYHGDGAMTFAVGEVSDEAALLMTVTKQALLQGIEMAKVGNRLFDIGYAIQQFVESNGFSVVRELVGHGIGTSMHEDPQVPNYGIRGTGPLLTEGMTLAIEPMVNAGGWQVAVCQDGWTVVTRDDSLSAHFEHTIAITEAGPIILTQCEA
jgi:methionyl aminopeptidase